MNKSKDRLRSAYLFVDKAVGLSIAFIVVASITIFTSSLFSLFWTVVFVANEMYVWAVLSGYLTIYKLLKESRRKGHQK